MRSWPWLYRILLIEKLRTSGELSVRNYAAGVEINHAVSMVGD